MNPSQVVADCADARAAAAAVPYTVADAIADAQWVRRTPDAMIGDPKARKVIEALLAALERSTCYLNAMQRGQEVFVMVQQDRAAPAAISTWATVASRHGCAFDKVDGAFRVAERWRSQADHATKWPD